MKCVSGFIFTLVLFAVTVDGCGGGSKGGIIPNTLTSSDSKEITSFGIVSPAATGIIAGNTIAVTVPYGTSLNSLTATFYPAFSYNRRNVI